MSNNHYAKQSGFGVHNPQYFNNANNFAPINPNKDLENRTQLTTKGRAAQRAIQRDINAKVGSNAVVLVALTTIVTAVAVATMGCESNQVHDDHFQGEVVYTFHNEGVDGDKYSPDDSYDVGIREVSNARAPKERNFTVLPNLNNLSYLNNTIELGHWARVEYIRTDSESLDNSDRVVTDVKVTDIRNSTYVKEKKDNLPAAEACASVMVIPLAMITGAGKIRQRRRYQRVNQNFFK
jgi:hypothetical protein